MILCLPICFTLQWVNNGVTYKGAYLLTLIKLITKVIKVDGQSFEKRSSKDRCKQYRHNKGCVCRLIAQRQRKR